MSADGSDQHRLTGTKFDVSYDGLVASPDRRYIAFVSSYWSRTAIYAAGVEDGQILQLTPDDSYQYDLPSWSPDSKHITFSAEPFRSGNTTLRSGNLEIYSADLSNNVVHQLTENRDSDFTPVWSPDGQQIAFISDRDGPDSIYLMNFDGSEQHRLFSGAISGITLANSLAWSPDSQHLLFTKTINGHMVIRSIDTDAINEACLTNPTSEARTPVWSPDGKHIAFIAFFDGIAEVYTMNANGSGQRRLTLDGVDPNSMPAWSREGTSIAFASANQIWTVDFEGANLHHLTRLGGSWPVWIQ